jgi:HD-GYP domain-containing protein (c-di-GMP phosphodiesterase class II)
MSFRMLTAMVTTGLVALSILAVSQTSEKYLRETLSKDAKTKLLLEARNLAMLSSDALLNDYPELTLVPLILEMDKTRPELNGIVVLDHKGFVRGHADARQVGEIWSENPPTHQATDHDLLQPEEDMYQDSDLIRVRTPVSHSSQGIIGNVFIGLDRSFIEAKIRQAREPLVKVAGVLLVVSITLVTWVFSLLFRPVKKIEEGLIRIGKGDLTSPLPVRGSTEWRKLALTLNGMASDLLAAQDLAEAREKEILDTQREVITTLGEVVESRSHETANHTRRVGAMAQELGLLAGLDEETAELLLYAAPMHDVGKIGIPDGILNKPGELTSDEYQLMQTHAIIGYNILKGSKRAILKAAAVIARDHHEYWDGNGYPFGKSGEDIHLFGRITALVDVFDALAHDRIYRKAMPQEKYLQIIREGRGTHFDPRLVDLFMANLDRFLAIGERHADAPEDISWIPIPSPRELVPS